MCIPVPGGEWEIVNVTQLAMRIQMESKIVVILRNTGKHEFFPPFLLYHVLHEQLSSFIITARNNTFVLFKASSK